MTLPREFRQVHLLGPEHIETKTCPLPAPRSGEVIVRVEATLTCGTDLKTYRRGGHPTMIDTPGPFGHEGAGQIRATADEDWRVGERVVVSNSASCGTCERCADGRENLCSQLQYLNGTFAEYLIVPSAFVERGLHRVPEGLDLAVAALAEPYACVLHCLDLALGGRVREPEGSEARTSDPIDALVLGLGSMGLMLTAELVRRGHQVVCADPNPERLKLAARAGATRVLEVSREGGEAKRLRPLAQRGLEGFDLAIEATGSPTGWSDAIQAARPGGEAVFFSGCAPGTRLGLDTGRLHYGELTLRGVYHHRPETFRRALDYLAQGHLPTDLLLSVRLPLDQASEAFELMKARRAIKVVLEPWGPNPRGQ